MTITIDSFKSNLMQFSHPGTLTPGEASRLTLILLEVLADDDCDAYFLKFISRFLSRDVYGELIEERNINKLCAYPLCREKQARAHGLHRTSVGLPYEYLKYYCTKTHFQCSEFYKAQLSPEALFARPNVTVESYGAMEYENGITLLEEVLQERNRGASLRQVLNGMDTLTLQDDKQDEAIQQMDSMIQDFKIVENEQPEPPTQTRFDDLDGMSPQEKYEYLQDQSKAIDGYVLGGSS